MEVEQRHNYDLHAEAVKWCLGKKASPSSSTDFPT